LSSFDFATGQMVFCNPSVVPPDFPYGTGRTSPNCSNILADNDNFAPRIGFAYRLTSDSRTVLRGGYGIFYDLESTNPILNASGNPPFSYTNSFHNDPVTPTQDIKNVFALTPVLGSYPSVSYVQRNFVPGYYGEWNLALQREFLPGLSVDAAYVGSKGTHLIWTTNDNQPFPGPGDIQPRRPYPLFGGIGSQASGASSVYHSLQLKAEKRMGSGLTFLTSYTYAKSIDNASDPYTSSYNPWNTTTAMRGPSDFDETHRFVQSWLYALPFGRGRKFGGSSSGFTEAMIGGWNFAGIYTFGTGFPFTPNIGPDEANIGLGGQVPIRIGNGSLANPTIHEWYDPTAFILPAQYTFGNSGRGILRGPNLSNLDFSLRKTFNLTERQHLDFRAEFFNSLNHPNFGMPDSTITDSSAGKISSTVTSAREIQFALRYYF